jgi:hypothetical protein
LFGLGVCPHFASSFDVLLITLQFFLRLVPDRVVMQPFSMGDRVQFTSRNMLHAQTNSSFSSDILTFQVLELVNVGPSVLQTAAAVLCSTSAPETIQVLDIRALSLPGPLEISLLADVFLKNGA